MEQRPQYRRPEGRPQTATAAPVQDTPSTKTFTPAPKAARGNMFKKFWWIPVVVLLIALGAWYFLKNSAGSSSQINASKYQAVFLNNGQVYFGKLHGFYGDKPYLTDVYYIQAEDGTAADENKEQANTQKLIKLGKEIHGPENTLILNKNSVLFVENLTDESSVVKAIKSENQ